MASPVRVGRSRRPCRSVGNTRAVRVSTRTLAGVRGGLRSAFHGRSSPGTLCRPWPGAAPSRRFRRARSRLRPGALVPPPAPLGRLVCPVAVAGAVLLVFEHLPAEHLARLVHRREVARDARGTWITASTRPATWAASTAKPSCHPSCRRPPARAQHTTALARRSRDIHEWRARVASRVSWPSTYATMARIDAGDGAVQPCASGLAVRSRSGWTCRCRNVSQVMRPTARSGASVADDRKASYEVVSRASGSMT